MVHVKPGKSRPHPKILREKNNNKNELIFNIEISIFSSAMDTPNNTTKLSDVTTANSNKKELHAMLDLVTVAAMENVWSKSPCSYQLCAITSLLKMHCKGQHPSSLLLVQGTGTGKSTVPQTVGVITCGVTLVIENTLSLGADQRSKFKNASQHNGPITAYQLDSIMDKDDVDSLISMLLKIPSNTNASIFLYSSPEKLLDPKWSNLVDELIKNKILKLICVDEVHQFVLFTLSFRTDICKLKNSFFKKIKDTSHTHNLRIPLLLMTATMTIELVQQFEQISGIILNPNNYVWASATEISRRHICINFEILPSHILPKLQNILKDVLENNLHKKVIVYTSTAKKAEDLKEKIDHFLDDNPTIKGDTMLIYGNMYADVKFLSTVKFTNKETNPQDLIDNNEYYPCILFATASCIGNGLDLKDVFRVIHVGFPTSSIDCVQEMG